MLRFVSSEGLQRPAASEDEQQRVVPGEMTYDVWHRSREAAGPVLIVGIQPPWCYWVIPGWPAEMHSFDSWLQQFHECWAHILFPSTVLHRGMRKEASGKFISIPNSWRRRIILHPIILLAMTHDPGPCDSPRGQLHFSSLMPLECKNLGPFLSWSFRK